MGIGGERAGVPPGGAPGVGALRARPLGSVVRARRPDGPAAPERAAALHAPHAGERDRVAALLDDARVGVGAVGHARRVGAEVPAEAGGLH
jgi:hypothetical protein